MKLKYFFSFSLICFYFLPIYAVDFNKLSYEATKVEDKKASFYQVYFRNGRFYAFGKTGGSTYGYKDIVYASKTGKAWQLVQDHYPEQYTASEINIINRAEKTLRELECLYCRYYQVASITFGNQRRVVAVASYNRLNQGMLLFSHVGKNFFPVMGNNDKVEYIAENEKLKCFPFSVVFGNDVFIAGCVDAGKRKIIKSKDGKIWRTVIPSILKTGQFVIQYVNKSFIIYGHASGKIMVSSDGEEWKKYKTKVKGKIADIAYGNGTYVFVTGKKKIYIAKPN